MRHHYLVTYDISDDDCRIKVFQTLRAHGDHAQYSVFFCALDRAELSALRTLLRPLIHHEQDQILIVDLGPGERSLDACVEVLGRGDDPPTRVTVV